MKLSSLHLHTLKEAPKDETSINASLLVRAGYVEKLTSGVYNFLPLGLRVMKKIENIIREEMNEIGGQEVLMAALQPKQNWEKTNRWQTFNALFKVQSQTKLWYALGPTHEEVVTPLAKKLVLSYKDLPFAVYQIQTKFRDEPRSKSGLLRTREFLMKDLYSFHRDEKDLDRYYEIVKKSYIKIFKKLNLKAILVEASGGTFSRYSHEFQVVTEAGEDTIYYCSHCGFCQNAEIIEKKTTCPICHHPLEKLKGIEVGNIFKLKDKYSQPFDLKFKDLDGQEKFVQMGCYGIGVSRIMGALAEVSNDSKGLIWPESVAPFQYYLLPLFSGEAKQDKLIIKQVDLLSKKLEALKLEFLVDDRRDVTNGEKLMDSDLLGIPYRIIISTKTLEKQSLELKERKTHKIKIIKIKDFNPSLEKDKFIS
jgi:prolyl-tRNA synthetase